MSQSRTRVSAKSRPDEVSTWMKSRAYTADQIPFIVDVNSYRRNWIAWWTSFQPTWRQGKGWPLPRGDTDTTNWAKVCVRGRNGLFLVVMSTTWWAASIKSEKDWGDFDEAVADVQWVIGKAIDFIEALPQPAQPTLPIPPQTTQEPPSSSGIGWMARAQGKRLPRPTTRLLEGGGL